MYAAGAPGNVRASQSLVLPPGAFPRLEALCPAGLGDDEKRELIRRLLHTAIRASAEVDSINSEAFSNTPSHTAQVFDRSTGMNPQIILRTVLHLAALFVAGVAADLIAL
jgi:hypothetical protein